MEPDGRSHTFSCADPTWLGGALASLRYAGFAVVTDVLDASQLDALRGRLYAVQERIRADVGADRLARAGEHGVLRLMLAYDLELAELLALEPLLALVDATVSDTAILHLQNGFILPPMDAAAVASSFQTTFHRDFPRHLEGYLASLNVMVAIDAFTEANGATLVAPATHQRAEAPETDYLKRVGIPVTCPAGSLVAFDSTLWHAAGANASDRDRLAVNHQFTRSWIKQQVDYVRALGDEAVLSLPPRTQQLLGWYTRVVTSLDEYYRPAEERLYRGGQG